MIFWNNILEINFGEFFGHKFLNFFGMKILIFFGMKILNFFGMIFFLRDEGEEKN